MSTKHTPGPWSCDVANQPIIVNGPDDSGNIVALVYDKDCAPFMGDANHQYHVEVAAANARLIAAAPDLLAALDYMVAAQGKPFDHADRRASMTAARAALAKAKGAA